MSLSRSPPPPLAPRLPALALWTTSDLTLRARCPHRARGPRPLLRNRRRPPAPAPNPASAQWPKALTGVYSSHRRSRGRGREPARLTRLEPRRFRRRTVAAREDVGSLSPALEAAGGVYETSRASDHGPYTAVAFRPRADRHQSLRAHRGRLRKRARVQAETS